MTEIPVSLAMLFMADSVIKQSVFLKEQLCVIIQRTLYLSIKSLRKIRFMELLVLPGILAKMFVQYFSVYYLSYCENHRI